MNRRVVIVTGAAGGIGSAIVGVFRANNWYVVGLDRHDADNADRFIRADHSVPAELQAAFEEMGDLGDIDALVNNAAIHVPNGVLGVSVDEWDLVMATNVRAAYLTTQLAHPQMQERGGAIVNVSSVHAIATTPGVAAYATSKGALVSLTRASAVDLARDGIRVNAVLPGAVDTPMLLAGVNANDRAEAIERLAADIPLSRIGSPKDVAHAVLFLADPERSAFVTGQTLVVDGGATSRLSTE